jgi:hypothetical protein
VSMVGLFLACSLLVVDGTDWELAGARTAVSMTTVKGSFFLDRSVRVGNWGYCDASPEAKSEELIRLQNIVAELGETQLCLFPSLAPEDVRMLGAFVQLYNLIDLNLRRCVETFAACEKLPADVQVKYLKLPATKLVATVKYAVQGMDPAKENISDTIGKLDEIEFRRPFRNLFAHWAARRLPNNEPAIVFLTKYEADAVQTLGTPLEPGSVASAVMFLADIYGLCIHIDKYEKWIAQNERLAKLLSGKVSGY